MKIRELMLCLNDCRNSTSPGEARRKAESAIRKTLEFIRIFERSTGVLIPRGDRASLSKHLWNFHVEQDTCSNCPYFEVLSPWRSLVATTSLWLAWAERERKKPERPAIWSAFKTLSIYLSLDTEGFRTGEQFKLRRKHNRDELADGNNRVRLLAAMDMLDLEVEVVKAGC